MTAQFPPASILVADDDEDDFFFTARLLSSVDPLRPILRFYDGSGLIDYLNSLPDSDPREMPEIVFLDLKMRGLNGFEFLEWFCHQKRFSSITIVVLSGSDEPHDIARARKLGASHYLVKSPSASKIASILEASRRSSKTDLDRDRTIFFSPKKMESKSRGKSEESHH